jgi:hypothetical protein
LQGVNIRVKLSTPFRFARNISGLAVSPVGHEWVAVISETAPQLHAALKPMAVSPIPQSIRFTIGHNGFSTKFCTVAQFVVEFT